MKSMKNNQTRSNDGLVKEFHKTFWDKLKTLLMRSINQAFFTTILSILQRQAVIKFIEKEDCAKWYIKSWKPISLTSVDTEILSKPVSNIWKAVLPTFIFLQQTAYGKDRFVGGSVWLTSDIVLTLLTMVFLVLSWGNLDLEKV